MFQVLNTLHLPNSLSRNEVRYMVSEPSDMCAEYAVRSGIPDRLTC